MIRAVLDTNVLVSGVLSFERIQTPPAEIYERWYRKEYVLVVSPHIIDELRRTLANPYFSTRITLNEAERAVETILQLAWLEELVGPVPDIATHPEDDLILATAVSAGADYLVTGDRQVLALERIDDTAIVRARQFVDILDAARQ